MQISVIGSDLAHPEADKIAENVGKEIAKAGATLICGGKIGIMEAACRGAKSGGGTTVGILPFGADEANEHVDIKIPTELGYNRNSIVANSGDAVIAICGSIGTLTEIIHAVAFRKPLILLQGTGGVTDFFDELEKVPEIKQKLERFNARIFRAKTAKEAVDIAIGQAMG